jgi:hypothetical protein
MIETQQEVGVSPRVYRPSRGWRAFLLFLCAVLGIPAAVGIWYFGTGHETQGTAGAVLMVAICLAFLLLSAYLAACMIVATVKLLPDRIETRDLLTKHVLARDEIAGRRILNPNTASACLVLVPRHKGRKQLKISKMFNFDGDFNGWLSSLPDLDEQDLRAAEKEIADSEEIGATPDARLGAFKRGKQLSRWLTIRYFRDWGLGVDLPTSLPTHHRSAFAVALGGDCDHGKVGRAISTGYEEE